ncbi:hypothetical protein COCNU_scaffold005896G000090 [Cocos nucifera]|nr:hypothetical protein [Cocos nucifera]
MEIFGPPELLLEEDVEGRGTDSPGAVDRSGVTSFTDAFSFLGALAALEEPPAVGYARIASARAHLGATAVLDLAIDSTTTVGVDLGQEKGLSDLACHYLSKAGVSAIRRLRKTDNNRIAKACGAVIVNRPEELQESDVGTGAGLFEVKKFGDEFFAFIVDCKDPKACTVLLRGATRNILKNPKLLPGGGATELAVSAALKQKSSSIEGIEKWPYEAAAVAFEAIPRTLAQNCGVNVIRTMTALQGKMPEPYPNVHELHQPCRVTYVSGVAISCRLSYAGIMEVLLKMEEEYIENLCMQILKFKPDLVITEKGLSDLACHYLSKAGVSAIRRLRKTDNNRIAKACGAVIVNRPEELQESDVGTGAGLFEVKKFGDEFFAFIVDCKDPKACTVLLRGATRNILKNPKLLPGGGATELAVSAALKQKSSSIEGIEKWPYEAAAVAFEAIPRTLAQNCGVNVIRTMTALQGKIWDSYNVKVQTFKTAIEAACMLLRIDDIVSGIKKKQAPGAGPTPSKPKIEEEGDADNEQILPE